MKCPKCEQPTKVLETNKEEWVTKDSVSRKRMCLQGHRFLTEELLVRSLPDYRPRKLKKQSQ